MYRSWLKKIEQRLIDLSDQEYDISLFNFKWVLIGLAFLYGLIVRARVRLYSTGILPQKTLSCFVISIGNIMAGGTGKTPMTMYLAHVLKSMGKSVVVVSRGYKGTYKGEFAIVSDGKELFSSSVESGDEPFMMAKRKLFPVVVGKTRFKAGKAAIDFFKPDVIILDDGFQHVQLARDLDILLFDHDRPLGNNRILPAGRLRETPSISKKRTHAIAFTRCPGNGNSGNKIMDIMSQFGQIPFFKTCHVPFLLQMLLQKKNASSPCRPDTLKGRSGLLFSGISNNQSFKNATKELGVNVVDHIEFKDHHRYKEADILMIQQRAVEIGCDLILTTEKDWVKLDQNIEWKVDLAVIGIKIVFEKPQEFKTFIGSRLNDIDH